MKNEKSYFQSFISGGVAGICAKTVISPIERIKLLYITRNRQFNYVDAIEEVKFIYRSHGVFNFWRGNSANVVRIFPQAAIKYVNDPYDKSMKRRIKLFICGSVAGMIASTITYPFDFLRTRMAMQRENFSYANIYHALQLIYSKEGIKSFYSGIIVSLLGVSLYHGSGFFFFTIMKEEIIMRDEKLRGSKIIDFCIGGFGSFFAQVVSYPFDILKKRMQGQRILLQTGEISEILTLWRLSKNVYTNEGIVRGFYKGITLNIIKAPLSSGTAWTVKNSLNRYLDKRYDL